MKITTCLVKGGTLIEHGAPVGITDGLAHPLEPGQIFRGFAQSRIDSRDSGDGKLRVDVQYSGQLDLLIPGTDLRNVLAPVYYAGGRAYSLRPEAGSFVGVIVQAPDGGSRVCVVEFNAAAQSQ